MSRRHDVTYTCDGCGHEGARGEKMPDTWQEVWYQEPVKDGEGRSHLRSTSIDVCSTLCLARAFGKIYPNLPWGPQ